MTWSWKQSGLPKAWWDQVVQEAQLCKVGFWLPDVYIARCSVAICMGIVPSPCLPDFLP
jgi:hypothetical protein